jgi:uncharacterized protein YggE
MRIFFITFLLLNTALLEAADIRLISVTGEASKAFQPDIVRLNINVWGKGESAKKAQANNQTHFEVLKKSVDSFKIKKEDVQTTSYDLSPEVTYDNKTNKNVTNGYNVNQNISITLRKVEDVGSFIDSLSNSSKSMSGGVSVQSLGYDISKRLEEERNLLKNAVEDAESKAHLLASAAKVKIKGIYRLAPRGQNSPVFEGRMAKTMMADAAGGGTQMMNGEVKVSAEILAEYSIE